MSRSVRNFASVLLVLVALTMSACSKNNGESTVTTSGASLIGKRWVWVQYESPPPMSTVSDVGNDSGLSEHNIIFNSTVLYSGSNGCNGFFGHWATWENVIYLIDLTTSGRFCPESLEGVNVNFSLSTGAPTEYYLEDNMLFLVLVDGAKLIFEGRELE